MYINIVSVLSLGLILQVSAMPRQHSVFFDPGDITIPTALEKRQQQTAQEGLEAMSNTEQCPNNVPPENRFNRTMQWPDGTYVCAMDGSMHPSCIERCGGKSKDKDLGEINNCMGVFYASGPCKGRPLLNMVGGSSKVGTQLGYCQCENGLVAEISKEVLDMLPAIASFGCALLFEAFDLVLKVGLAAIPGGAGASTAMVGGMRAAKIINTSLKGAQKLSTFTQWFAPCGNNKYTQMAERIFNPLVILADRQGIEGPPKDSPPSLFSSSSAANPVPSSTAAPPPPPPPAPTTQAPAPPPSKSLTPEEAMQIVFPFLWLAQSTDPAQATPTPGYV